MDLTWSQFKNFCANKPKLQYQCADIGDMVIVEVSNGPFKNSCVVHKDTAEYTEFLADWVSFCNKDLNVTLDEDGAQVMNPKLAGEGKAYQATFMDFKTSDPSSLSSVDWFGAPLNIASIKIFDVNGDELTEANKAQAVCTVLSVMRDADFYIQGFTIQQAAKPTEKVVLCAAFAPHIPKEYGGCKEVIQGCNLQLAPYDKREIDWVGDSASLIKFDSTYFSHIMALKLFHPPGFEHQLQCEVIWYV